ncbi:cadmium resistance transporter [Psychromicrobium xiongbiense]|uniref:cadmium resistance transporter n=1 Tax=Psychromicrobium xiongbiense TaxID=3051184 RepID=UPI0025567A44|nr:cadmium resistance transporter [Psychromicrobium sp. YIM S02556]
MNTLIGTVLTAVGAFAATNLDDLLVLSVLFVSARSLPSPGLWRIWVGQYLGIGILTVAALLGAEALTVVAMPWVGLLGLVPLCLGAYGLIRLIGARHRPDPGGQDAGAQDAAARQEPAAAPRSLALPAIAAVTVANGGDNLSVYIPLFHSLTPLEASLTVLIFAVMIALWCAAGFWLTVHPAVGALCRRAGHWAIPAVYLALGIVILLRSGVIGLILTA